MDIRPTLETRQIDEEVFNAKPSESNRIWIAGRAMEERLGASVGSSRCCSLCVANQSVGRLRLPEPPSRPFRRDSSSRPL